MKEKKTLKETTMSDAIKAVAYSKISHVSGGYQLSKQPNYYCIAIKWLLAVKKISYETFGRLYNDSSKQNMNHMLNHMSITNFLAEDFDKICKIIKVSREYFDALCDNVKDVLENKDGVFAR